MSTHNMFLCRTEENDPIITTKYSPLTTSEMYAKMQAPDQLCSLVRAFNIYSQFKINIFLVS